MSRCRRHRLSKLQLSVLDQEISAVGFLWSMEGIEYMNHGVCFVTGFIYFAQQLVLSVVGTCSPWLISLVPEAPVINDYYSRNTRKYDIQGIVVSVSFRWQ